MNYLPIVLIFLYTLTSFNLLAIVKFDKSRYFHQKSKKVKSLLLSFHLFTLISNILLYFWIISNDFYKGNIRYPIGFLIFILGITILFWGIFSLKKETFITKKNDEFILKGPYKYVRHPMYLGGVLSSFGLAWFFNSFPGMLFSVVLGISLISVSYIEERDLKIKFGQAYATYEKQVPRIIPKIF